MIPRRAVRHLADDAGSLAVEMVFILPAFFLLLALLFLLGRVAEVNGNLQAVTRDAARAASLARSSTGAQESAEFAVGQKFNADVCNPFKVVTGGFEPASNVVTVSVTCGYAVSELGVPGVGKRITVRTSFASALDPDRVLAP